MVFSYRIRFANCGNPLKSIPSMGKCGVRTDNSECAALHRISTISIKWLRLVYRTDVAYYRSISVSKHERTAFSKGLLMEMERAVQQCLFFTMVFKSVKAEYLTRVVLTMRRFMLRTNNVEAEKLCQWFFFVAWNARQMALGDIWR